MSVRRRRILPPCARPLRGPGSPTIRRCGRAQLNVHIAKLAETLKEDLGVAVQPSQSQRARVAAVEVALLLRKFNTRAAV